MLRVNCTNVTLTFVAVYSAYLVYIYFIQHQPNAPLLAAIKSKSTSAFQEALTTALSSLTTHQHHAGEAAPPPPLHALHFGHGRTVAAAIAMHGTTDMLQHWHALGGDLITPSTTDGRTPLHVAAVFNSAEFVELLLALLPPDAVHGALHGVADNGYTALLYAVLFSRHDTATALLARGADPGGRQGAGARYSAAQLAAIYSDARMMDVLVEHGAVVGRDEPYYADWHRGWLRVQRAREEAEAEAEAARVAGGGEVGGDGVPVEVDGEVVWVGDEGQASKARYWQERQRIMDGEDPYEVFKA